MSNIYEKALWKKMIKEDQDFIEIAESEEDKKQLESMKMDTQKEEQQVQQQGKEVKQDTEIGG